MTDVVIIGAGTAGLTAALYAGRSGLDTVIVDKSYPGGQIALTAEVENFPGFDSISGIDLIDKMSKQVFKFGAKLETEEVKEIVKNDDGTFDVKGSATTWKTQSVILALGAFPRTLDIPGEKKLTGRGVSYCATCDGPFFRDKEIVVVGGGDTALDEAIFLTQFASMVYVVHRRTELRAEQILQDKAFQNPKIEFLMPFLPVTIDGENKVEGIQLRHRDSGEVEEVSCDGVFVFVGYIPSTEIVERLVELDAGGYVITNQSMSTNIPGIYACGDCRSKILRQAVTACGEGATAAFAAYHHIQSRT